MVQATVGEKRDNMGLLFSFGMALDCMNKYGISVFPLRSFSAAVAGSPGSREWPVENVFLNAESKTKK